MFDRLEKVFIVNLRIKPFSRTMFFNFLSEIIPLTK